MNSAGPRIYFCGPILHLMIEKGIIMNNKPKVMDVLAAFIDEIEQVGREAVALKQDFYDLAPMITYTRENVWDRCKKINEEQFNLKMKKESLLSLIPRFYGRLVILMTKNHGQHHYIPLTYFETVSNTLVIKTEEVEKLERKLEKERTEHLKQYNSLRERIRELQEERRALKAENVSLRMEKIVQTDNLNKLHKRFKGRGQLVRRILKFALAIIEGKMDNQIADSDGNIESYIVSTIPKKGELV